jgi:hypothetical protein
MTNVKDVGYHLALSSVLRLLLIEVAKIRGAASAPEYFVELSQRAFQLVDGTYNPSLAESDAKIAKEAAYETLRLIFDSKGLPL